MAGRNLFATDPVEKSVGRNLFAQQPEQGFVDQAIDTVGGVVEPALAMVSSMIAEPVANIGGGIQAVLNPNNPLAGPQSRDRILNTLTFEPRTESGQRVQRRQAEALAPVGEFIEKTRLGDEALEAGLPEFVAKNAEAIPEFVGAGLAGLGLRQPKTSPLVDKAGNLTSPLSGKRAIGSKLRNNPDGSTAKFDLNKKGKVVNSPVGNAALNQGWQDITVAGVKNANPATKTAIRKMVNIARGRGKTVDANIRTRPSDVLGESLFKRYKFLEAANKSAGKSLGATAKKLGEQGVKPDLSGPMTWLKGQMDEVGISILPDGKINFAETSLPKSDFGLIRENMSQIQRVLRGEVNFNNAHQLKQILRRTGLSFEQTATKKGASPDTQNLFKGLSSRIDKVLDSQSEAYNLANVKFSETADVLSGVKKIAKDNLFLDSADKFLGKTMRRITSNAVSRDAIVDIIDNINESTSKYGGNFNDDLLLLQKVTTEMDNLVDVAADTSIKGELGAQAAKNAIERSALSNTVDATLGAVKFARTKRTPENALNALQALTGNR